MERRDFLRKTTSVGILAVITPTILLSKNQEVGKNFETFKLVLPGTYFVRYNVITGPNNVPILILTHPEMNGMWATYECNILSGDPNMSIPGSYLEGEVEFRRDYSIVEKTLGIKQ